MVSNELRRTWKVASVAWVSITSRNLPGGAQKSQEKSISRQRIEKGDLPNTKILEALLLEPTCRVKQHLNTCSLISQFMETELENRLKKTVLPWILDGNFEIWIRPVPQRISRNATIPFNSRGGQKWHEYFSTLTSEGSWLSEPILMFRVSVMYALYLNWLLLSTSYGKRKQI